MSERDRWTYFMVKHFERQRKENGDPWPGYWAGCILNYAEHLRLVWC